MSIFDNIRDGMRDGIKSWLGIGGTADDREAAISKNKRYAYGAHKQTLKVAIGKTDDNLLINIVGLIVDRWVSWLFGKEIEFDLPGDDTSPEQTYIDEIWRANNKSILLHRVGVNGTIAGTAYIKIVPNGDKIRLIAIDPQFVTIDTDPEDIDSVIRYTISYTVGDKEVKEISENVDGRWTVTKRVKDKNRPEYVEDMNWLYPDFAPIVHCQNLPSSSSVYGIPDITDPVIKLQDAINLVASNTNKAIRLHSAPQLWGKDLGAMKEIIAGTDKIIDAGAGSLSTIEMSEMTASSNFLQWLVKQLYATTRTIDLDSLSDKLGNLTNFGLRVLYEDTLTKLETKRALYGDMLTELNRRLLLMGGMNEDAGDIHWADVIPQNQAEEVAAMQAMKNLGVISNETIAMNLDLDYTAEQEKIANDKTSESNLGAALLSAFNRSGNQVQ